MKKVVIISKSNFTKRFWKINIIKTGNIGKGIISSLLSGPSRLAQVIGLSVGMYSVCLLHSGRQLPASLHWRRPSKRSGAERGGGGAEEQCAKTKRERERERSCV